MVFCYRKDCQSLGDTPVCGLLAGASCYEGRAGATPAVRRIACYLMAVVTFLAPMGGLTRASAAENYTPTHPVVMDMVEKAVTFLEGGGGRNTQYPAGGAMLSALAIYKVRLEANHPQVERGVRIARDLVRSLETGNPLTMTDKLMYEASVAAILLGSVDIDLYKGDCAIVRDFLLKYQRPYGGFGYLVGGEHAKTGDISQTQYVVLALWTIDQMGVTVPTDNIERALLFLQKAQDPNGGWGYQAKLGIGAGREPQEGVTHSLSAAGLCSILICGDFLGFYRNRKADAEPEDVPKAFRRVIDPKDAGARKQTDMDASTIQANVQTGIQWHTQRPYERAAHSYQWYYYYLYSKERMEAFVEIVNNKQEKSPAWYNKGVEELRGYQAATGGFGTESPEQTPEQVCTAFAVLFLIRSTQKAIGKIGEGVQRGNYGLPKDLANIQSSEGKLIDNTKMDNIEDMINRLETSGLADAPNLQVAPNLKLDKDPKKRRGQLDRLARLMQAQDAKARVTAAKLLGRGDDLDYVPVLLYGLTDPDGPTARASEDSLRILSRRLKTRFLPEVDFATRFYTKEEMERAKDKWLAWYRTVRPDYIYVEPTAN